MTFKIPYTFIPGTKAKANEVNSNFTRICDYLKDIKSDFTGLETHLQTVDSTLEEGMDLLKESKSRYCVNVASGVLLTHSDTTLYFCDNFSLTNQHGESAEIINFASVNCNGYADGTYNVFVGVDETIEIYNNAIHRQGSEPVNPNETDIWVNTEHKPLVVAIYNGGAWEEYDKVPVGSLTILNSILNSVEIFPFNQNGFDINTNTKLSISNVNSIMPEGMDYVIDCYPKTSSEIAASGGNWWRLYRSGKIEQGGIISFSAKSRYEYSLKFSKPFTLTNYTFNGNAQSTTSGNTKKNLSVVYQNKTVSSILVTLYGAEDGHNCNQISWSASGF